MIKKKNIKSFSVKNRMEILCILDHTTQNTHSPKENGVSENSHSTMSYLSPNHSVVEAMVSVLSDRGNEQIYGCKLDQRSVLYFYSIKFKDIRDVNPLKLFWQSQPSIMEEAVYHDI